MESNSHRDLLLQELNNIYQQLDELFFYLDDNTLSDTVVKLLHMKLQLVTDMLNGVLPK